MKSPKHTAAKRYMLATRSRDRAAVATVRTPAVVTALAVAGVFAAGSAAAVTPTSDEIPAVVAMTTSTNSVGILTGAARPLHLRPVASQAPDGNGVDRAPGVSESPTPTGPSVQGIPAVALAAYRNAELVLAQTQPGCGIDWSLLAGIGRIESGHAGGGNTDADGTTVSPILGPALDGTLSGNEVIGDGQGGYVRAIGPMQFLPSTWSAYASDGNGDGDPDPNNVFDAALGAARYLCSGGLDLRDSDQRVRAVLRYNNSTAYASDVLGWSSNYSGGGAVPIESLVVGDVEEGGPPVVTGAPEVVTEPVAPPEPSQSAPWPAEPAQPMITIPGLPPIPCGIFCPPPAS